jgi:hypothetical protein
MGDDPFGGVSLATDTVTALDVAAARARDGGELGTFDILAATIAVDAKGHWETVQLRTTFVSAEDADRFRDTDGTAGSCWRKAPLTRTAQEALKAAADLARSYDLLPLPPGALALGLVWDSGTGAARALLEEAEIDHRELLDLLQEELLDTRLQGLDDALNQGGDPPPAGPLARDATTGVARGPQVPLPGASLPPLEDPEIRRLLEGAELFRNPTATNAAWVFARDARLLKIYDLRPLGELERKRIKAEASIGLSLADIPGVLPTLSVREEGGWLVVETPQIGGNLEHYLELVGSVEEPRQSAETYADLLAHAAATLQRMHDRGLVHRGIEPASLLIDASGEVVIGDIPVGVTDELSGQSRYWAPERYAGEVGQSMDQYALGVTARDVFTSTGAPPLTEPVHAVLQKATAPRPAERFATVSEFAEALRAAVSAEAPRGLSDRVAGLSAPIRAALTPTAIAMLVALILATAEAPGSGEIPELSVVTTLLLLATVIIFCFGGVALAGLIRGRRTFASLRLASRPLPPFIAFVALTLTGLDSIDAPGGALLAMRSALFAYGACALLAPAREDSATWLILLLGRWDGCRAWPPGRRRAVSAVLVLVGVAAIAAPTAARLGWDNFKFPEETAREFGPLSAVWNLRVSLARDNLGFVCDQVLTPAAARGPGLCRETAKVAAMVQSADPATNPGPESFGMRGTLDTFRVQPVPAAEGLRVWNLLTPTGKLAGAMYTEGTDGTQIVVMISRQRPKSGSTEPRSMWLYQVVWTGSEWKIDEYRACVIGAPGTGKKPAQCAITNSTPALQVKKILAIVAHREEQQEG